jgi:hypothetical protein
MNSTFYPADLLCRAADLRAIEKATASDQALMQRAGLAAAKLAIALCKGRGGAPSTCAVLRSEPLFCGQPALSTAVKYSNNWKKAKTRVQKIHSRMANVRKDFLHKTFTTPPSTTLRAAQPKPRARLCRKFAGAESIPVFERHGRTTGQASWPEIRPESRHPRSRLGRTQAATGVQAGLERGHAVGGAAP